MLIGQPHGCPRWLQTIEDPAYFTIAVEQFHTFKTTCLPCRIMLKSQKDPIDLWLVSTSHTADQPAAPSDSNGAPDA